VAYGELSTRDFHDEPAHRFDMILEIEASAHNGSARWALRSNSRSPLTTRRSAPANDSSESGATSMPQDSSMISGIPPEADAITGFLSIFESADPAPANVI
jgi:hypothetical protein